jgi:hypothetical protein
MSIEKIERVPFEMQLGQPEKLIGWATIERKEGGGARITIDMGSEGEQLIDHFTDIAEIMAIGFAGIIRKPSPAHKAFQDLLEERRRGG